MDQRKLEGDLLAEFGPVMMLEDVSQIARINPEDVWDQYQSGALDGYEPVRENDVRFATTAVAEWLSNLANGSGQGDESDDGADDEEEDDMDSDDDEIVEERIVRRKPRRD